MKFLLILLLVASPALAQVQADPNAMAPRITEVLRRSAGGHSPAPEDIVAVPTLPPADDLPAAIPLLLLALQSEDRGVRNYSLAVLASLQTPITPYDPANPPATPLPFGQLPPSNYKADAFGLLAPAIPQIAPHLTEESLEDRALTATILGGFSPNPPATVYPPLYAYLKRADAIGPIGQTVVSDLLALGPISSETADAVARYLRRSDQTPDARANLVDLIAGKPNQSILLNKSLIGLLDSDDPGLRARVILSLPQLELSPELYNDTRFRVRTIAENPNELLPVVNAAKAVAPCWTSTKMTSGCPSYE